MGLLRAIMNPAYLYLLQRSECYLFSVLCPRMRQSYAEVSGYPQETCKISLKSSWLWYVELFL